MAAETNLIKAEDLARVREVEFVSMFNDNVIKLMTMLGVTRKIAKQAGAVLKSYKATGQLVNNGAVGEGETIPLSHYETEPVDYGEITLKKWRKATSAEAIVEKGYDQAVTMTTDRMLKDVQKAIRTDFLNFLANANGTAASGAGLQAAVAATWGKLQILFEDDDVQIVHFINPEDVADYLATAQITTQTAFGMTYIENFLGMGTAILTGLVTKGTMYSTAQDNIVLYYVPVNGADLNEAFSFTSDETGYIGIHEVPDYTNLTASDTVLSGMLLFADREDGIVKTTITTPSP